MKRLKRKPIQIYLDSGQDRMLEILSGKQGVSKSALIRESIEKYLKGLPAEDDPAMGIIGLGSSSKGDLAEKHDRYLAEYSRSRK